MTNQDSEASRRMHDYLLNKQRRKEEYWIRKYGRVRGLPEQWTSLMQSNLKPYIPAPSPCACTAPPCSQVSRMQTPPVPALHPGLLPPSFIHTHRPPARRSSSRP